MKLWKMYRWAYRLKMTPGWWKRRTNRAARGHARNSWLHMEIVRVRKRVEALEEEINKPKDEGEEG